MSEVIFNLCYLVYLFNGFLQCERNNASWGPKNVGVTVYDE